ncbi:hypothetical protein [Acinetobacter vivianii]|uniref:hypothetical protein n=1 Tax=Acinetobacter vivianii TaxID=1776742 RepID=UPI002DBAA822|nr:hypothetical protein [Acinetobacter vivianii]MEB6478440.1 hypothetical protein [Acinetobacter vivianii]MEB6657729.1 hypothetical protein [Acinetobacter vivianii]
MNYEVNPKATYLLEQFSSLVFFETMRNNYRFFLDSLEELFEIYMHNLPYNLRSLPYPEQADIQWGETVLPNLRNTMDYIDECYVKIKSGDFTYLDCVGDIRSNDKGLSEFSPHWMDDLPKDRVEKCWDYYSIAKSYASIIGNTYPTYWEKGFLEENFPSLSIFNNIDVMLPVSYPIYRINPKVKVHSKEKIIKTGVYVCNKFDNKLKFLAASSEDDNGFAPRYAIQDQETGRNIYYETTWTLVERIADEGGSSETIQIENLKGFAGQTCQRTGNWWSPANQLQSHYFEQGEVFPEVENNSWGETIWYLEVTNKK